MRNESVIDNSVLNEQASHLLEAGAQGYILTIMHYIAMWDNLLYAYVVNQEGIRLSEIIGPMGANKESSIYSPTVCIYLERIVNEYLSNNNFGMMLNLRLELEDGLLFIGSLPDSFLILYLSYNKSVANNKSRLSERIEHLKTILSLPKE